MAPLKAYFPGFLRPPEFNDEDDKRVAQIIHVLCLMILLGLALTLIHSLIDREWSAMIVIGGGMALVFCTYLLCQFGNLIWAARLLTFSVLATSTVLVCTAGRGIHDVVIMVYPSSLVVASQILTRRSFIVYTAVLILSILGVSIAEINHFLVIHWSVMSRWTDLVDILVILIITAVAVEMLTESLKEHVFRFQRNAEALGAANLELERNAKQLRESEENYRQIFNTTSDAIIVYDAETGSILNVNKTAQEMYGYSCEEFLKIGCDELSQGTAPYSGAEAANWIRKAIGDGTQVFEWRARRKGGELFWVEVALKCTTIGGEGCVMAVVRDISVRKKAQEELRESQQMLRSILDTIPVRLFWKDMESRFLGCNLSFAQDAGVESPDEIIGKTDFDLIWKEHAEAYCEDDRAVIESGQPKLQYEEPQVTIRGRKVWVRTNKAPLLDAAGKIRGVLGSYEDITEHKLLEAQLRQAQKMEAFGQLAGGVAHDFNNLLTVILSNAALIEMQELSKDKISQFVHQINHAADRAANLTRQLLTFSRRQALKPVDLDLNDIVENMAKMLQRLIGERISLHSEFLVEVAPVHADPGMMEQVLMNLAVNSRDAMPKGGTLILRTDITKVGADVVLMNSKARAGRFVRLSVVDTGSGISPENMSRIFEPFFTTKEADKGTGLGLATVFGIVQQHNGWIDVESREGEGTTFSIFLPCQSQLAGGRTQNAVLADLEVAGGCETILVVEDEEPVRSLARNALELKGYVVFEAGDGSSALEVWKEHMDSIDLVMTDLIMPGKYNGHELAEKLQSEKPGLKVIYCSGYSDEMLGSDHTLRQRHDFLQKPYNLSSLARLVRRCLDETDPAKGRA